jgi:predicted outer membrane repeat protein
MNQGGNGQSLLKLSRLTSLLGFWLAFGATQPMVASAANITVTNPTDIPIAFTCNLRQAIVAHDEKKQPFPSNCTAGDGNDTITIGRFPGDRIIDLGSPVRAIENGTVTIKPSESRSVCVSLRQSAYMRVNQGATLNLEGIGIVVNGAEFLSPIDNDGGTLNIFPHGGSLECDFSNQHGRDRKPSVAGVLNNRNGGTATIDANFINSSAGDRGGAILIDSGTVTIKRGDYNNNDAGGNGGAIFINGGATLKIASSNFTINKNRAGGAGGAIYSNGANLIIQRDPTQSLGNVSIASNSAGNGGGAIFALGGQLSVDEIQINNNSSNGSGGAIVVSGVKPPNPASISRTYFHDNSSNTNGGAIYLDNFSALNLSASTFTRDRASRLGGGVYVDVLSSLNVLNSTFLGGTHREGLVVNSGLANVVFSTILAANLGTGSTPNLNLSNSILREVTCASSVHDDGLNLQFQSTSCPGSIPTMNPDLDTRLLQNNGGPTPTVALLAGSPAVDAIAIGDCVDQDNNPVKTDQRGFGRPAGPACDIGAFELGATPIP